MDTWEAGRDGWCGGGVYVCMLRWGDGWVRILAGGLGFGVF